MILFFFDDWPDNSLLASLKPLLELPLTRSSSSIRGAVWLKVCMVGGWGPGTVLPREGLLSVRLTLGFQDRLPGLGALI